MIINHNMGSINANRMIGVNQSNSSKSMEKLSSGLRINRAGDDAAGLAISEKMRAQVRGLDQASTNAQDGISMIQTAEGALSETHSILQRMRELAVQSSNDTNVAVDRGEIQKEINQLTDEIDRIANNTEFNQKKLLNGSLGKARAATTSVAEGTTNLLVGKTSSTNLTGVSGVLSNAAFKGQEVGTHEFTFTDGVQSVVSSSLSGLNGTETLASLGVTSLGAFEAGDDSTSLSAVSLTGLSLTSTVADFVNALNNEAGIDARLTDAGKIEVYQTTAAATKAGLADAGGNVVAKLFGVATATSGTAGIVAGGVDFTVTDKFTDAAGNVKTTTFIGDDFKTTAGAAVSFKGLTFNVTAGNSLAATDKITFEGLAGKDSQAARTTDGSCNMQIGANENQAIKVDIEDMSATALGVRVGGNAIDVTTSADAGKAVTKFNNAIEQVSAERAKLGAYQNRLEHTISNLGTSSENLTSAESRIRDVNMAKEMSAFTKNNILSQAAQAMLAQANQQPQQVLQLLR